MSSPNLKKWVASSFNFSYLKNKKVFGFSFIVVILILATVGLTFYYRNTEEVPAPGGSYTEGLVGSPRHFNPIFAPNSEVDQDVTELLFAGLMDYGPNNELTPYLARSVDTENYESFEVTLREAEWSDGEEITAEDVLFTVEKIQSQSVNSPLKISWEGVEAEKISERKIEFNLDDPSPLFLEKLTLAPIPKHIWEEVPEDDFQFSDYNLEPVTSGSYKLEEKQENKGEITEIKLSQNPHYFGGKPFIEEVNFKFFESEGKLLENEGDLDGLALPSIKNKINTNHKAYQYQLPRYFGVFFNLEEVNENLRKALAYGTDKSELLSGLENKTKEVSSPILPDFYGLENPELSYNLDQEKAIEFLEEDYIQNEEGQFEEIVQEEDYFEFTERLSEDDQGEEVRRLQDCLISITDEENQIYPEGEITGYFGESTTDAVNRFQEVYREDILDPHNFSDPTGIVAGSTQEKLNEFCGGEIPEVREPLKIEITTISHPLLIEVYDRLEKQWEEIGVDLERNKVDLGGVEERIINERDFEGFLFGVSMESIPDPFRWWHSSQVEPPGLNFTGYENEEADELLRDAISIPEEEKRNESLVKFQNVLLEDKPALFLYSPDYIHLVDEKIQNVEGGKIINTSQRLGNVDSWYINTKRTWKNN